MNIQIRKPITLCLSLVLSAILMSQPALAADLLRQGDKGSDVKEVQIRLTELGLLDKSAQTGYFGPKTEDAVTAFQRYVGLKADGIVGDGTRNELFETYAVTTIVPGSRGSKVKDLQQRLADLGYYDGSIDGIYGLATKAAVKTFQKYNGLTSDGIAGKQTLSCLKSGNAVSEKTGRRTTVTTSSRGTTTKTTSTVSDLLSYAQNYLGCPYVYGANGPKTFDCSGFTTYVFKKFGVSLPRTAQLQGYSDIGTKITKVSSLKAGDLVFFNTVSDSDSCDHVGIYMGNGKFIHASSGSAHKVTISDISSSYYSARFSWGRRVIG